MFINNSCYRRIAMKNRFKSHFRFNNKRKHHSYIIDERNNKYDNVLLSSKESDKGKKSIPLDVNPNPKSREKSFLIDKLYSDEKYYFDRKEHKDWKFSHADLEKIKRFRPHDNSCKSLAHSSKPRKFKHKKP